MGPRYESPRNQLPRKFQGQVPGTWQEEATVYLGNQVSKVTRGYRDEGTNNKLKDHDRYDM
ncbi:hypothetical protein N7454_009850 [Penicillium verhagenii]|nr:hypothetical protein N7454_009850 [Penicillium verhagenii]